MTESPNFPKRIQLSRKKGWRIGRAWKVARPTKWGNPFTITSCIELGYAKDDESARKQVVVWFSEWLVKGERGWAWFEDGAEQHAWIRRNIHLLRGKTLACWCPLDQPCHADILIEWANGTKPLP